MVLKLSQTEYFLLQLTPRFAESERSGRFRQQRFVRHFYLLRITYTIGQFAAPSAT
ncbi:MAG: hypothetical protein GY820_05510 [Gammaproteobacteria bacterium]|nr:hypothetical protein [Gammaproteobacteria bacterium]